MVKIEDHKLIFNTLWSHISSRNSFYIQRRLNDFHVIKFDGERFTPNHYNKLHNDAIKFLTKAVAKKSKGKTLVITHHVPTLLYNPPQYKGDALNEAFATELHDKIEKAAIDYWIYGHHHNNTSEFKIGGTTLLTNQLGYVQLKEHLTFQPGAFIQI